MEERAARRSDYPLTIPDALLNSEAMRGACATRNFQEIFRLVNRRTGSSQAVMASAIGRMTTSRISDVIQGRRGIRGQEVIERIADGFGIPGAMLDLPPRPWERAPRSSDGSRSGGYAGGGQQTEEAQLLAPAEESVTHGEVEETKRRDAVTLAGLSLAAPAAAAQILEQAAAEAAEFTRQAEVSMLGPRTLDHLDQAVTKFWGAYFVKPPQQLFDAALEYRRKANALLNAKHSPRQGRELLTYAGCLSELLAWLAHDLGNARTGLAFANDAFVHGKQAGHSQLCAWAMDAAASINLHDQRPANALAAARKGLTEVPTDHPLTVRLHAQAARACAADGNAEGFTASFRAAEDAYDRIPPRPARWKGWDVLPLADYALTSYPATAYVWLGQAGQAREYAERALAIYETAPPESRSPNREAIARIDLGLAHAQLGAPGDAVSLGHQALDSTRLVDSVRNRAGDLASYLGRRYPRDAAVKGLRERLATAATPATDLPA